MFQTMSSADGGKGPWSAAAKFTCALNTAPAIKIPILRFNMKVLLTKKVNQSRGVSLNSRSHVRFGVTYQLENQNFFWSIETMKQLNALSVRSTCRTEAWREIFAAGL